MAYFSATFTPQGPYQNFNYYLVTSGLPIDPLQGSLSKYYYNLIVKAAGLQAEIGYEFPVRIVPNVNAMPYLNSYNSSQRNVYQFLIGLATYSDPFNKATLTAAVQNYSDIHNELNTPNLNDFSFGPLETLDISTTFDINFGVSGSWVSKRYKTYYSDYAPYVTDGGDDSVWIVNTNGRLTFYYKKDQTTGWNLLTDYGPVTYATTPPTEVDNSWWINPSDMYFAQFNGTTWDPEITYSYSSFPPIPTSGTYWLTAIDQNTLEVRQVINTAWSPIKLSPLTVMIEDNNSSFRSVVGNNNFIIDDFPDSIFGGPITTGSPVPTNYTYDEETATGGANEVFPGFFTHVPINSTIEVFINGQNVDPPGYNITGQTLSFIDSANSFTLNAGDLVVAYYQY
jgi:hypothetical protein